MDSSTDVTKIFTEEILCLKHICMVSVATILWDKPFFKREIASCYKRRDERYSDESTQAKHYELEQRVVYNLKQLDLPQKLLSELEEVVLLIGSKLSEHICYVPSLLNLDLSYIDKVYWTSYGTIDRLKIYESWKKIPNFIEPNTCAKIMGIPLIYFMAAVHVDKKFFEENQNSIIESIESSCLEIKIRRDHDTTYHIISVLISLYQFRKVLYKYLKEAYINIPALDMFQICYKANYINATEYFWKVLNENGNVQLISELIDIQNNHITGENFYFLIKKMSLDERNNFFKKYLFYLARRLAADWPFSKLLLRIYDSDLVDFKQYCMLFTHNLVYVAFRKFMFSAKNKLVVTAFAKIWNKLSISNKLIVMKLRPVNSDNDGIDQEGLNLISRVNWYDLMYNYHFQCLKMIMNDPDLQSYRTVMDADIVKILLHWLNKNQEGLKQINIFMHEVLISNDEREKMKKKLNLVVRKKYSLPDAWGIDASLRDQTFLLSYQPSH